MVLSFDEGKIQVSNVHGIEASVLLNAIEDTHHTLSFRIRENMEKNSLQPQDVKESKKVHLINSLLQYMAACSMIQAFI